MDNAHFIGSIWEGPEGSYAQDWGSSRKSLLMALEQKGGEGLEAWSWSKHLVKVGHCLTTPTQVRRPQSVEERLHLWHSRMYLTSKHWVTSDFRESPDGNQGRFVMLERQLTSRKVWLLLLLLHKLCKLQRKIWSKGSIPSTCKVAEGCFVLKGSAEISLFQTISLLSIEAKIFLSVLARRMTTYMMEVYTVDTSIQKGGIPGFSGCLEHTTILSL